jgi:hypothetical protein
MNLFDKIKWLRPHKELKYTLQRLWYGFSAKDTWSLDLPLAKRIVKALIAFERWGLDDKYGYPVWLWGGVHDDIRHLPDPDDEEDDTNTLVWFAIIHRLIDGFERIASGEYICGGYEEYELETLALFETVYPSLWT